MHNTIVAKEVELSERIETASRLHPLQTAAGKFLELLKQVPDNPAERFSPDSIAALRAAAERVIGSIEGRVASDRDANDKQQQLVETVYDIRAALEEIDRWHRHYCA